MYHLKKTYLLTKA